MNPEIQNLLNEGRKRLAAFEIRKAADIDEFNSHRREQEQKERDAVMALIPESLHQYAVYEHGNPVLFIILPSTARLATDLNIRWKYRDGHWGDPLNQVFDSVEITNDWSLARYCVDDEEAVLYWRTVKDRLYGSLEVALVHAVELGDGKEEAEAEAARQRQEMAEWDAPDDSIDDVPERVLFCPLMNKPCVKDDCAWFVAWRMGACSLKVWAHGVADGLDVVPAYPIDGIAQRVRMLHELEELNEAKATRK
jgi:hypothetical protein